MSHVDRLASQDHYCVEESGASHLDAQEAWQLNLTRGAEPRSAPTFRIACADLRKEIVRQAYQGPIS